VHREHAYATIGLLGDRLSDLKDFTVTSCEEADPIYRRNVNMVARYGLSAWMNALIVL
jgi:hypothetical protein